MGKKEDNLKSYKDCRRQMRRKLDSRHNKKRKNKSGFKSRDNLRKIGFSFKNKSSCCERESSKKRMKSGNSRCFKSNSDVNNSKRKKKTNGRNSFKTNSTKICNSNKRKLPSFKNIGMTSVKNV